MSGTDRLLAGLTDEQREAVTTEATPLLVLAGAGSGKTRVLTRRIAWQAAQERIDTRRVLAVTFTRKAASELVHRLRDLGISEQVTAGTFHSLALAQLRRHWLDRGRHLPKLLDRKTRLVGPLLGRGAGASAAAVAREIEYAQARLVPPEEYEALVRQTNRHTPIAPGEIARVYLDYEHEKRRRGLVDFDDLLAQCADAIERDPELAAAVRWRFRHVFVDEFQDLNPAQFRLLRAWLGDRRDLCAVGDDEQAIYGFGGADARYVTDFVREFGDGDTGDAGGGGGEGAGSGGSGGSVTVLRLTANFRSTPQILELARALAPAGRPVTLHATGADGPPPVMRAYDTDADEARAIAATIAGLQRDGVAFRDVAVLARTNAQLESFEAALTEARVPARIRSGASFLDRPAVERALRVVGEAEAHEPGLPFEAHLEMAEALRDTTVGDADAATLAAFLEIAEEYASVEGDAATSDGLRAFLTAAARYDDPAPRRNAVDVLTFHRAKGLEWPVVFVTGLEDGFVPISHAQSDAERDEERRLLYVAVTRAQRSLYLSWARARQFGERTVGRTTSPFLVALDGLVESVDSDGGDAVDGAGRRDRPHHHELAGDGRAEVAAAAARLRARDDAAPTVRAHTRSALFHALVDWREHRARAAGVAEVAILDDDTLRVISEQRPSDTETLEQVPGIGAARLARFGGEILDLVAGYAGDRPLPTTHETPGREEGRHEQDGAAST